MRETISDVVFPWLTAIKGLDGREKPTTQLVVGPNNTKYVQKRNAPDRIDLKKAPKKSIQLLQNEMLCLNRIDSPYVPKVHAFYRHPVEPTASLFVEFVPGKSLDEIMFKVDEQELLETFRDISFAVQDAQDAGVSHHDIKPDNIVRNRKRSVLIDWGIAKCHDFNYKKHGMNFLFQMMTQYYAPPEQIQFKPVQETDIYLLARTLIYCINRTPYTVEEKPNNRINGFGELKRMLRKSLSDNIYARPTIEEFRKTVVEHLDYFSYKGHKGQLLIR